jgi:hypothetical protein
MWKLAIDCLQVSCVASSIVTGDGQEGLAVAELR